MVVTVNLAAQLLGLMVSGLTLLPSLAASAATIKRLLESGTDPTPEEEASIRAAMDESEAAVQAL